MVRQTVGYQRFDTGAELLLLNQLYDSLRLYTNFFQPTMKLKSKERIGSRVKKRYEPPQTPYHRLLDCEQVTAGDKRKLQRQFHKLNPAPSNGKSIQPEESCFVLPVLNGHRPPSANNATSKNQ